MDGQNLAAADEFTRPFQEAMTAWCWGFDIDDGDMALIDTMDRGDGFAWATGDPRYME